LKKLDLVLAWVLVVLGFVYCGEAVLRLHGLYREGVWFFGVGVAIAEAGFLNVLRSSSGRGIVRLASILGNILLLLIAIATFILLVAGGQLFSSPLSVLFLLVIAAETLFSISA
jgi:hypothetical protein